MTSHDGELSRNMDRITQLQDGIDHLVTIMYSTLSFLKRKADFRIVNPDMPITQTIADPARGVGTGDAFGQNCEELALDFVRKAKQLEFLISILPPQPKRQPSPPSPDAPRAAAHAAPPDAPSPASDAHEFRCLQDEVLAAEAEYAEALEAAKTLHLEIKLALRNVLEHRAHLLAAM